MTAMLNYIFFFYIINIMVVSKLSKIAESVNICVDMCTVLTGMNVVSIAFY
jgi:hypothetical protein